MASANQEAVKNPAQTWQRVALAILPPLVAGVLQAALWPWISPFVWFLFYPALFASSSIGGRWGGVLGCLISVAIVELFFMPQLPHYHLTSVRGLFSVFVFMVMGLLFLHFQQQLTTTNERLRSTLDSLKVANDGLECRVKERTSQVENALAKLQSSHSTIDAALASMSDAVFISDSNGHFTEFNEAFATYHRFANKADCLRNLSDYPKIIEVYFPNGQIAPLDMWAVPRALRGETVTNAEYKLRRKDTGEVWVGSYNFGPIRDQDGKIVGAVVVGRDVTDQKREEEEIRALNAKLAIRVDDHTRQLEVAVKDLESFSYSVSHDLRAPLRHICGFVELLRKASEGQLSEKSVGYLATIQSASQEMGQLIDDLLAFSKMGKVEMHEREFSLDSLVREIVQGLTAEAPDRNITWKIGLLPQVIGDPSLIRQVLLNFLRNSIKYSSKNPNAVIEIGIDGNENGRIVVFVADNGVGFDMRYASKLFGVFQRLHRSDEFEGTGIGLATVRNIVSRHGGRTWGVGELGVGATFYFTLKPSESLG